MEDMMTNGIRSYGPGKFHTIIDSHAYEMALEGIDEEISIENGGGWYGFMMLGADGAERIKEIAEEAKEPLTEDEENFLRQQAAVIFFERSDGIVEATWYNDELAAKQDWEEIENEYPKKIYTLREESGATKQIRATNLQDAEEQARDWVEDGDYPDAEPGATTWCRIYLGTKATGPADAIITVEIGPKEEDEDEDTLEENDPKEIYTLREESGATKQIRATNLQDAEEQARDWVEDGDYPDAEPGATTWCRIYLGTKATGPADAIITVEIGPKEEDGGVDESRRRGVREAGRRPKLETLVNVRDHGWMIVDKVAGKPEDGKPWFIAPGIGYDVNRLLVYAGNEGDALEIAEEKWPDRMGDRVARRDEEQVESSGQGTFFARGSMWVYKEVRIFTVASRVEKGTVETGDEATLKNGEKIRYK